MKEQQIKQVKIQPRHRALTYEHKEVPELRISGVWLEKIGFKAGDHVSIISRGDELVIKRVTN